MNNQLRLDQLKDFYVKYKIIIWPVIVGVSALIVLLLVIIPQILDYLNIQTEVFQTQSRLFKLEAKAKELTQIDDEVYKNNLQIALNALPAEKEVPQSLNILQSAINQNGMTLQAIKYVSSESSASARGSFTINMTVGGPFDSLKKLLEAFQRSPRVFKLNLLTSQAIRNSQNVEAEISLDIFYESLVTNIGAPDTPLPVFGEKDQQLLNDLSSRSQAAASNNSSAVPLGKVNPFE